ncbi:protein serine/threonine kinase [Aureococcus anophagefferens]|uniref:Protein serine/threonine kinase n=1 Tax=Aureococcus anophagefferens TaxID=44056 RepID=A0ABR1GDY1_AURAN
MVAAEVGHAILCLHGLGVVHRDVKPANVLVDAAGHCLLSDLGLATVSDRATLGRFCGTLEYVAPERQLTGALRRRGSVGARLHGLRVPRGRVALRGADDAGSLHADPARAAGPRRPSPLTARGFLGACSPRTPARLGATEAAAFFDAPFFEDLDWRALGERALPPPLPKAPGDSGETFAADAGVDRRRRAVWTPATGPARSASGARRRAAWVSSAATAR